MTDKIYRNGDHVIVGYDPQVAVTESIIERVTLWEDHAYPHGYRAKLQLLHFDDGEQCLELSCGGSVTRKPYTFPFLERDRL